MKIIDKLASKDKSRIGMILSDSKDISIKFAYQCINILNNKEIWNGFKGSTKMQKKESLFKYQ